jgi:hypothetical protein
MLGSKLGPAAPFYVLGQRPHGFLGDFHAFAAINRGLCDIDSGQNFGAAAFSLDPKHHCGLHRIFGTLKPAACDGSPDKILLLGSEVYLHMSDIAVASLKIKEPNDFNAVARIGEIKELSELW